MTIPTFPTELPVPLASGYGAQRYDPRRRRAYDAGPPKFARRYSAVARSITLTMRLFAWQVAKFDRFYIDDCQEGSLPFYMKDYRIDGLNLLDENGLVLTDENDVPLLWSKIMLCAWGDTPPSFGGAIDTREIVSFSIVELP
ncbi:hypothetical protein JF540_22985 [Salipiger thiooxidans]|uniref:hypothetical protein n=1 Tax=Salipiger thiooxidans TaxID=282683 RepID=UPI001A8C80FB|nr:hypothetical protein [Salipiger thiooxidans]MBN8189555.1 hypothetical protein [Salipiger thiooxidans]